MRQVKDKRYDRPELKTFANAQEVWSYYRDKGSPDQRARLRQMLGLAEREDVGTISIRRRA